MKPGSALQPFPHYFADILKSYEAGRPLTPEQLHFLANHQQTLGNYVADSVIRYYMKSYKLETAKPFNLLFPKQKINHLTFDHLKEHVEYLLHHEISHVDLKMTPEQFLQFRAAGIHELIFWHGNHFLTGAPFFAGGIPYVVYFQWGNLFGVVKYQVLPEEKAIKGNVMIYFEDMEDRYLYECIKQYEHKAENKLEQEHKLIHAPEQPQIQLASEIETGIRPGFKFNTSGEKGKDEK